MTKRFRNLGELKSEDYLHRFELYRLGHSVIDDEHRDLLRYMELVCKLVVKQSVPELKKAMDNLETTMAKHFRHEEILMREAKYPFLLWHETVHASIEKDFKITMATYLREPRRFSAEFAFASAMESYVVKHIDDLDRQFVDFLETQPTRMGSL